jgi:DNA-binding transcriptional MerR regulator
LTFESGRRFTVEDVTSLRISQLANRSGVPATTLRFYETAGLLPADRTAAGYRVYGEVAVERLAFIGAAKHLGLPLEEIAELLAVWESGACKEVKADLRPRIAARIADAEARAAELAAFTSSLHRALDHLGALPDRPGRCDPACGFLVPDASTTNPMEVTVLPNHQAADAERWRTAPVACSLTGEGVGERTAQWRRLTTGAEQQEIEDGLRLTLPADRAADLTALAAAEQQCCPFFDFRFHLDGPVVHLEVRAPAEGAGLLTELFALA